ncbi:MAG: radical SAM protein [Enterocloster sp.]
MILEHFTMKDSFGRNIDYMRISITDRCNLRCKYCMPDGVECLMPAGSILSLEEIEAIAICAAGLGIQPDQGDWGEPLVRRDCCQLVKLLKSMPGIEKVTITTNGVLLDRYLEPLLAEAGIDGINIKPGHPGPGTMYAEDYRLRQALGLRDEDRQSGHCAMPGIALRSMRFPLISVPVDEEQRAAGPRRQLAAGAGGAGNGRISGGCAVSLR